ncbi:carbohydrate kinase family protein [Haploplasma axanthum]|uniref:5-dehydro-2-deoxygluconokinase n=1 Tax=Haploplasma axanthum TaxID=29552 RepID=A0A449BBA9_HAPAX|nr:carbohydrate kinase [Haploplasma axanthum]VEU79639.1 5-dehydro-2-deoxygluconokinase [Haploplasma axanthum]
MRKIISIGELLIDFIQEEKNSYTMKAGGAPANVAVTNAKLSGKSFFVGQVGNDSFGKFLINELKRFNVDIKYLKKSSSANTSLAFVTLDENKERSFLFYRNPGADQLYIADNISDLDFRDSIVHFCSVSLGDYPIRDSHDYLLSKAISQGSIISFDPNIRLNLWDDHDKYHQTINMYLKYANILKVADNELEFITRKSDYNEAITLLLNLPRLKYLIITKGNKGATLYTKDFVIDVPSYQVDVVDTTGAGDSFIGAFLNRISIYGESYEKDVLCEYLKFASIVASLTITKFGAMDAMPYLDEVNDYKNKKG